MGFEQDHQKFESRFQENQENKSSFKRDRLEDSKFKETLEFQISYSLPILLFSSRFLQLTFEDPSCATPTISNKSFTF